MTRQGVLFTIAGVLLPIGALVVWLASPRDSAPTSTATITTSNQAPVFDVPTLIGLNIEQLRAQLGQPSQFTPPESVQHPPDLKEWDITWTKGSTELLVTYELATGKVKDFFVATDDPSGKTRDLDRLKSLVGVRDDAANYSLSGVVAMNPQGTRDSYTGLKVVPK